MKKQNLLKSVYHYEKAKIASYNSKGSYLKISHLKIIGYTLDRNGFVDTVKYYNSFIHGDYPKSSYYSELKFTSSGIEYRLYDNLQEVINGK